MGYVTSRCENEGLVLMPSETALPIVPAAVELLKRNDWLGWRACGCARKYTTRRATSRTSSWSTVTSIRLRSSTSNGQWPLMPSPGSTRCAGG